MDFYQDHQVHEHPLIIGRHALIRSNTVIYAGSKIGDNFQTGHYASIREDSQIGSHVSVGTLCNIQGDCQIGNYVRMHSNVQIGQLSKIDDYVWISPNVVLMNDPTPPSNNLYGVHVCSFAIIATGALIHAGVTLHEDCLVAANTVVGSDVPQFKLVRGNPAKIITDTRYIRNMRTSEKIYPWRYHFKRAMPWEDSDYNEWYESLEIVKE